MKITKITSLANENIKNAIKLTETKNLKKSNVAIVESYKVVKDLFLQKHKVVSVFTTEDAFNKKEDFFKNLNCDIFITTKSIINKLSNVETSDEIIALVEIPKQKNVEIKENFLVLDHVQDPTNMGAIIRSACAFNFKTIVTINCVHPYSQKVTRCSMSNNFNVNFVELSIEQLNLLINKNKTPLYCLNMDGENLYNIKSKEKCFGLILGSEGKGVNKQLSSIATKTICIPMQNNVESLNVAVSASIVMSYFNNL